MPVLERWQPGNQLKLCVSGAYRNRPWDLSGLAVLPYPFKVLKSFISRGFWKLAMAGWNFATVVLHLYLWGFAECFGWVNFTLNTFRILNGDPSSKFNHQQHNQITLFPLCLDSCVTTLDMLLEHEVAGEFQWPGLSLSVNLNKRKLLNKSCNYKLHRDRSLKPAVLGSSTYHLLPVKQKNYPWHSPCSITLSFVIPIPRYFTVDLWASFHINQCKFSL